jgi:hypothetical protein
METNWVSAAAGFYHSIGVKSDGTLWSWGYNYYGQLGLGDTTNRSTLEQVGTDTNWVSVATGGYHTIGVKSDGTLWSWGYNGWGQLGDGTTTASHAPIMVVTDVPDIPSCSSISPTGQAFPVGGGKGRILVTATAGCGWTATKDRQWIKVSVDDVRGVVIYTVDRNTTGKQRTCMITIGGQIFRIMQHN